MSGEEGTFKRDTEKGGGRGASKFLRRLPCVEKRKGRRGGGGGGHLEKLNWKKREEGGEEALIELSLYLGAKKKRRKNTWVTVSITAPFLAVVDEEERTPKQFAYCVVRLAFLSNFLGTRGNKIKLQVSIKRKRDANLLTRKKEKGKVVPDKKKIFPSNFKNAHSFYGNAFFPSAARFANLLLFLLPRFSSSSPPISPHLHSMS